MRLGVDSRMIEASGIGRYLRELIGAVHRLAPDIHFALAGASGPIQAALREQSVPSEKVRIHHFEAPLYSVREQLRGARLFHTLDVDLSFFPHYNVPILLQRPFVMTVHDLAHLRFPKTFGVVKSRMAGAVMRMGLRHARRVFADSEATMRDLQTFFPFAASKVVCVPPGVNPLFKPSPPGEDLNLLRARWGIPELYVLTVGNRKAHKNLSVAANVITRVQTQYPELCWVVVGQRFQPFDDVDHYRVRYPKGVVELNNVSDPELSILYTGARAVLMPSLWEGFGYPLIEAMACGTPVVASDIPALSELACGSALLNEATDTEALAEALNGLLSNPSLRAKLSLAGLKRASLFTWQTAAERVLTAFRDAVHE